jgi:subtilisin family serine protease
MTGGGLHSIPKSVWFALALAIVGMVLAAEVASAGGIESSPARRGSIPPPVREPESVAAELLVNFRPDASAEQREPALSALQATVIQRFDFIGVEHVRFGAPVSTARAIATLAASPAVEYAEPNYIVHAYVSPDDTRFPGMYQFENTGQTGGTPGADIDAVHAWDLFTGDPELKVAILDTGINFTHPDLADNLWTNPIEAAGTAGVDDDHNGWVDDLHGVSYTSGGTPPNDDGGHGSHVSGTIAARGNNGIGVVGVNWRARLVAIKILDGGGQGNVANAIAGLQYAINVGAKVSNNSWGGGGYSQAVVDAITAAGQAGMLFVAACGNRTRDNDVTPDYPSSYDSPYIVSVAATDASDQLTSTSSWGLTTVDLAAPGSLIQSTWLSNFYAIQSGTSMAAAVVTGVCALVAGRFPELGPLEVRDLVLAAADTIPALTGKVATGGRANAYRAICVAPAVAQVTPPGGLPGDVVTIHGTRFGESAPGDSVYFTGLWGAPLPVTEFPAPGWTRTSITVRVPPGAVSGNVRVVHACGATTLANGWSFDVAGVGERHLALALEPPTPNPTVGEVSLYFELPRAGRVDLTIVGADGRRITSLIGDPRGPGRNLARWNGRDDHGRRVAPGVYYARLVFADQRVVRPFVLLR